MISRCKFLTLVAVCLVTGSSIAQTSRPALNAEQAQAEAAHFLQELVRIDTQDPPGNESRVARYLEGVLKSEGIDSENLEPVAGRASIVARLKGDGSKRPLLLMGHEDVVPVDRARWTVDPFAGLERDGMIWGRGAADDKAADELLENAFVLPDAAMKDVQPVRVQPEAKEEQ